MSSPTKSISSDRLEMVVLNNQFLSDRGRYLGEGRNELLETKVSSVAKEVIIGYDRPTVLIGERINPAGKKLTVVT